MANLFRNYINKSNKCPNNQKVYLQCEHEYWDAIFLGADIEHNFKIPHSKDEIKDILVVYTQGTEIKLIKNFSQMKVTELGTNKYDKRIIIKYLITPEETFNFNAYNREVFAQTKVFLQNGEIEYSPKYKVRIIDSNLKDLQITTE